MLTSVHFKESATTMAEILEGVVTETDGDFAKIRPKPHTACDDCQACNTADLIILAANLKKAKLGQTVKYEPAQTGQLTIAWVLFFQPLLSVFAGIGIGSLVAPLLPVPAPLVMGGFVLVLFAATVVYIRWFDRRYKLNQSNFAKITEVVPEERLP
jgi:positive regulator of sigma E activity